MSQVRVPFIDLKERYVEERDELLACVDRVLSKGHLVLTEEVYEFEAQVCAYTGAKHCIALNSGTDALMIGLWALGIGRGDEVITTPVSFVASTGAIAHVGATPVYADVRDDQNIDVSQIEAKITPRTKAILPVHWCGRVADMDAIVDIARRHGLRIVEDAAQSMDAFRRGKHGGTFGDIGAFSAHPLKNLNAIGDGGFMVTDDDEVAKKARLYRTHGLESRDNCVLYGVNSRLDSLNAEVLKFRLSRLRNIVDRRRQNVGLYRKMLTTDAVFVPPESTDERISYVMFIVQAERRDELKAHLAARGIETLVYYGTPLHLHPAAARLGYGRGALPVAEAQCEKVLALPHHQHLSEDQIAYVCEQVNAFYGG